MACGGQNTGEQCPNGGTIGLDIDPSGRNTYKGAEAPRRCVQGGRWLDLPGPMFETTMSGMSFAAAHLRVIFPDAWRVQGGTFLVAIRQAKPKGW